MTNPSIHRVLWNQASPETLVSLEEGSLRKWQIGSGDAQCVATGAAGDGQQQLWSGALHPKNAGVAAVVAGSGLQVRWWVDASVKIQSVVSHVASHAGHQTPTTSPPPNHTRRTKPHPSSCGTSTTAPRWGSSPLRTASRRATSTGPPTTSTGW